jgi:hypothetical protein
MNKIPTQDQLRDIATKLQHEDCLVSQRELLMQWQFKCTTKEELSVPAHHMRACGNNDQVDSFCRESSDEDAVRTEHESLNL